jgi:protein O-GlcNAc transferase
MNLKEKEQSLELAKHYFLDNNYAFAQFILEKVIKIDPNNSKANELLSYLYGKLGRFDISFEFLKVACSQSNCSPQALYYFGSIQLERGLFGEAIESFEKSMLREGEFFEALHDLATAQALIGDLTSALNNYQKCLKFGIPSYKLFFNIGRIYDDLKHFDEAIDYYDKALSLKPDYAEGWSNKGAVLNELKRFDEAIDHYHKALSHKSDINWAHGILLHAKMRICSWSGVEESSDNIFNKVAVNEKVTAPFHLLSLTDDAMLQKKSSEIYAQDEYPFNHLLGPIAKRTEYQKIRIGYFSPDFKNHPVSLLTCELFEIHDRQRFEVFAFSLQKAPIGDVVSLRLRKGFDRFIDVDNLSDLKIAQLARELQIDIAIDLAGPTQHSRTGIFSYRAAPIQVNWLGYPGTSGADFIDYIIADKTIIPEQSQQFYAEKVVTLPDTYMVDDSKRISSSKVFTRNECGLPENTFVFCCFNNDYKFNPKILNAWSRILLEVEKSVFWISENNQRFKVNLITEFERRGVDASRIIFSQRVELMADHLARYALADIFLDTHPYNAHTTAVDALKVGVPVLTLMGQSFASRVAGSLLNAIDLTELIANTQEEYEALAIELAKHPQKLADIKLKLINNRLTTPLFNTPLFTKNLESAYIAMVERYHAGLEPDYITIA